MQIINSREYFITVINYNGMENSSYTSSCPTVVVCNYNTKYLELNDNFHKISLQNDRSLFGCGIKINVLPPPRSRSVNVCSLLAG